MKFIQVVLSLCFCVLALISLQLRNLRPYTLEDYLKDSSHPDWDQSRNLRIPVIQVESINGSVSVNEPIDVNIRDGIRIANNESIKVSVEGSVSAAVEDADPVEVRITK